MGISDENEERRLHAERNQAVGLGALRGFVDDHDGKLCALREKGSDLRVGRCGQRGHDLPDQTNKQTKGYHARVHQRGLLELLSKIAVGFGGESVRCLASELLDLPIHHPIQLVFLQERALRMVLHAGVAAHAPQSNDVRVFSGRNADDELFQKRIHRCVRRSRDQNAEMLRVREWKRGNRVGGDDGLHDRDDCGGFAGSWRSFNEVNPAQSGTRQRRDDFELKHVELATQRIVESLKGKGETEKRTGSMWEASVLLSLEAFCGYF